MNKYAEIIATVRKLRSRDVVEKAALGDPLTKQGHTKKQLSNILTSNAAITLIALIITIIVLLIISGATLSMLMGENGLFGKANKAKEETNKKSATERLSLKITNVEIDCYAKEQRMPTLQELANELDKDSEIEYVKRKNVEVGSLSYIDIGNATSIYTKLKDYKYEFEINSKFQLASIDGKEVERDNNTSMLSADLEKWVKTLGNSEETIITVNDIIDNNLLQRLMENRNSVDYMFNNSNILDSVLNSSAAMEIMGKSKYAGYIAITNENYRKKVLNSKYVEYFDKGSITIPTLSNNDNVIYSSTDSGYKGYYAFDKNKDTVWYSRETSEAEYIGYNFKQEVIPYKVEIINIEHFGFYRCKDFYIQGANDDSKFETLTKVLTAQENNNIQEFEIDNIQKCKMIKMVINNKYTTSTSYSNGIAEFQVYCREIPKF